MKNNKKQPFTHLKQGEKINGYRILRTVELPEINSFYYKLEHIATCAQHIHIQNDDTENTFSVAFKTVPKDSSGVAHILEHTVLCGSEKFPVRDPFFSMLKRSLNTFMNAFTASDWTMYPFTTQNKKDFYNLMDVYLDAAFFPNLDELSFRQEGHRLEIDETSEGTDPSTLVFKGVVYNEMRGAMSSQDQVMVRSILNGMYPETTYHFNSGGDPAIIPDLTYQGLKDFHSRHYHPSNAFFFTYGHLPLSNHLEFIQNKILSKFDCIDPDTDVPSQARWTHPKKVSYAYPLAENENPDHKCQVAVAWLTADIKDSFEVLSLTLLEQILLGNPASPLRMALIESKLGTALSDGTGFDADNRDTLFSCGLKGSSNSSADEIETLIFQVLNDLVDNGIDSQMIESAIHQIEFHRKEITNTPYPYGLRLLLAFSASWFHGGEPDRILQFDTDLKTLRKALSRGQFFENQIKKYFLDNPHRMLMTLEPDQMMTRKMDAQTTTKLSLIRKDMTSADLEAIAHQTGALKALQETEENLSILPTLALEDIPPDIETVQASSEHEKTPAICYRMPTSGIFYFTAIAGAGTLPDHLTPLVPFFCSAFSKVGTALQPYADIARLIHRYTGGIGMSVRAGTRFDAASTCLSFISFDGKCLNRNMENMFQIINELFFQYAFSDRARLKSLLLEYQAGMESMIVQNGHRLAISMASRSFSPASVLNEAWHGIHQLQTLKNITGRLPDEDEEGETLQHLANDLRQIGQRLFSADNVQTAIIGENDSLVQAVDLASAFHEGFDTGSGGGFKPPDISTDSKLPREGWSTSSSVSFVARTFKTERMIHEDAPALAVISKILRSMYLHREIREKGGAYGGFALYNAEDGLFSLASYRDPHICATFKAFDGSVSFIKSGSYSEEDIKEAILQVCSEIDKPNTPGTAAKKAFYRKLMGLSDDARQRYKSKLLSLTRRHIIDAAEKYFSQGQDRQAEVVISGEEQLKSANEKLAPNPLLLHRI